MCASFILIRKAPWQGSIELHTTLEVIATLLALFVGIIALIHFYAKRKNIFLFIGTGFLGTAFLDGYHAIVTSNWFQYVWSSPPSSLIPWSWNASRIFLSLLMLLSWWSWKREERLGSAGQANEKTVFLIVSLFTLGSFIFFAFVPLPRAYHPEFIFGRPEEFIAGAFFLFALIGYLQMGTWKSNSFEHWVILSLIISLIGQVMFMSFSNQLFDTMFNLAHLLKQASYICVLTGLLCSMYNQFEQLEQSSQKLSLTNASLTKEIKVRKTAEDALKHERYLKHTLIDNIPNLISIKDNNNRFLLVNKPYADFVGLKDPSVALGKKITEIVAPQDSKSNMLTNKLTESILETGEPIINNEEYVADYEGKYHWLLITRVPLYNDDGIIIGLLVNNLDMTERKEAELERERLIKALENKTKEMEQVIYITSHDLRSPLVNIQGFAKELKYSCHDIENILSNGYTSSRFKSTLKPILNETIPSALEYIQTSAGKMDQLLSGLLKLSRLGRRTLQIKELDMNRLFVEIEESFKFQLKEASAKLEIAVLTPCHGDETQINQLFSNLIDNALKYRDRKRKLLIKVTSSVDGGNTVYTVKDNGRGISPDYQEIIFEIFHRLNPNQDEGEGLGLSIVQRIVHIHNGKIRIESEKERGSKFIITLPRYYPSTNLTHLNGITSMEKIGHG